MKRVRAACVRCLRVEGEMARAREGADEATCVCVVLEYSYCYFSPASRGSLS